MSSTDINTGQYLLRAENISKVVRGFALQEYVLKQLCLVESSSAWTESYYKETAADLTGGAGSGVSGVPRLANFPYGEVNWNKVKGYNIKHGMEGVISYEDAKTNAINVIARTFIRISRAIAKSVDGTIAAAILANAGNTVAANATWNNSVIADRDPIQDILNAKALLKIDNYNPDKNGYLICHPTNVAELLGNANVRNAAEFYTNEATKNGRIARICGLTLLETNSVSEGGCQVVIGKEACVWKSVVGLTVKTIDDPGVKYTIRAWEIGQIQVVNPDAICSITGI
jgi:hypothetical protein